MGLASEATLISALGARISAFSYYYAIIGTVGGLATGGFGAIGYYGGLIIACSEAG